MEKDLIKFYDNITYESKEKAVYADGKGNRALFNPLGLYCTVEYKEVEANEKNLKVLRFEGEVGKDEEPNTIKKFVPKVDEKDITKITEEEVDVYQLWIVSNGAGVKKVFLNEKDAINIFEKVKNDISSLK